MLTYGLSNGSSAVLRNELLTIGSSVLGYLRLDRKKRINDSEKSNSPSFWLNDGLKFSHELLPMRKFFVYGRRFT